MYVGVRSCVLLLLLVTGTGLCQSDLQPVFRVLAHRNITPRLWFAVMSQLWPLPWLQADQSFCNPYVLGAKQSNRTSNFNVLFHAAQGSNHHLPDAKQTLSHYTTWPRCEDTKDACVRSNLNCSGSRKPVIYMFTVRHKHQLYDNT